MRNRYPNLSAQVLDVLTQRPCTVAMLVHILAVPDHNVQWAIVKLRGKGQISNSRPAGQRYAVYSLIGAAAPMQPSALLARYAPAFVPRVYDARQCPFERAALCMMVRG